MILTAVSLGDEAEAILEQDKEWGEQTERVGDTEPKKGHVLSRNRREEREDTRFGGGKMGVPI